jgi:hypothetical protein
MTTKPMRGTGPTVICATGKSGISSFFTAGSFQWLLGNSHFEGTTPATFFTRRHSGRRPITPGGLLPATFGTRGKVRAVSGVGAAGAFSLKHGCSVAAGVPFDYSNF